MPIEAGDRFPPLDSITRPTLTTAEAAFYLNRKEQTLRSWACFDAGPIRPLRCSSRLMWPTARLRELCGLAA